MKRLKFNIITTTRGHSKKIFKERAKYEIRRNYFKYRVVDIWNSLPQKVVDCKSVLSFEKNLDKFWEEQDTMFLFREDINTKSAQNYLYKTVEKDEELIPKVNT